jgi:hypothetical protein
MRDSPSAFSPTKQNKIQIVSETKRNREREREAFSRSVRMAVKESDRSEESTVLGIDIERDFRRLEFSKP